MNRLKKFFKTEIITLHHEEKLKGKSILVKIIGFISTWHESDKEIHGRFFPSFEIHH